MEPYERMVKHTIRNVMGRSTKIGLLVYHIYNYIYTYIFMFNPTNEMMAHSAVEDHVGWGETSRCVLGPCHWLMFKPGYLGLHIQMSGSIPKTDFQIGCKSHLNMTIRM